MSRFLVRAIAPTVSLMLAALLLLPMGSAGASEFDNYGIESVSAEESTTTAGAHPDFVTEFVLNHEEDAEGRQAVFARTKDISVALPPGLIGYAGNPQISARCPVEQFTVSSCPVDSQVGMVRFLKTETPESEAFEEPLYNLQPSSDEPARLGFIAQTYPVFIDISIRTAGDYGVTAAVHSAPGQAPVVRARTTIWGVPAAAVHNSQRLTPFEALFHCANACFAPNGERSSGLLPKPFLSNPSACEEQKVGFAVASYELPGQVFEKSALMSPTTACEQLSFQPALQVEPTSHQAGAPTGLTAVLRIPQTESVGLPATSAMKAADVMLPEGMTLSSSGAAGLQGCSAAEVGLGTEEQSQCPSAAKLGTMRIISPALAQPLRGEVYQRTPEPGHLFRIWLVTDEFGVHLKLPGEVEANPDTGRLSVHFADTPQLPVEEIELRLAEGLRAPLRNPDHCGTYSTAYQISPWSGNPPVSGESQPFAIDQGCAGGGFSPQLEAGITNPVAGDFSPLVATLRREDGESNLSSFALTLPKGELAKLKGVPLCSDADATAGTCATASQIGSVAVAAGAGPEPLWIPQPGKAPTAVFLGGPYDGAPYSIVTEVPAQAGPFDLGLVTVRGGLYVDPDTTQVTFRSDALPQILKGVPVQYRTIHVSIDREQFTLNPTNCQEQTASAEVASVSGEIAHPGDRFQVGDCGALGFGPSLQLHLKGGAKRGQYPALNAVLKTHKDEANLQRIAVTLPHSEFLAQEHIRTICTRVQFAQESCPPGSVYGRARAVTPLLDQPLEGNVYLRSSNHQLPDLVVALRGQLDVNLDARIDSIRGGIRTTFTGIPDAPVTKFVLHMKGGKKSLLVNSTDICRGRHPAEATMAGQNGKHHKSHPLLSGCGRHRRK